MKGKIYKIKIIGSFPKYALVEDGRVYEIMSRSSSDKDGYFTVIWRTRSAPYKDMKKRWKYINFRERCDNAPVVTWKELYKVEGK